MPDTDCCSLENAPRPEHDIVEKLQDMLGKAHRGEIVALCFAYVEKDDSVSYGYEPDIACGPRVVAAAAALQHKIMHEWLADARTID